MNETREPVILLQVSGEDRCGVDWHDRAIARSAQRIQAVAGVEWVC
jgi:hypothetical protein